MDNASDRPISKVEVQVISLDHDFAILEIKSIQERIFWPRKNIERPIEIGQTFLLELKAKHVSEIERMVSEAKASGMNEKQDLQQMRKLLEQLIN